MSAHLKHSDYIPLLNAVGADWMVVSDGPVAVFAILLDAGTGASVSVTLPKELADGQYVVVASAEGVDDAHVDESTKTSTGFTVLKGTGNFASEVLNVLVIGSRLKSQPAPTS